MKPTREEMKQQFQGQLERYKQKTEEIKEMLMIINDASITDDDALGKVAALGMRSILSSSNDKAKLALIEMFAMKAGGKSDKEIEDRIEDIL